MTLNDPYSKLKPGECGVLRCIDSMGTYHIDWDSGSGLGLVPGEDSFNILPPETTMLKLYMPMTLEQYERNQWGDYEGEPVEIPAYAAAQYENLIHEAILRERASVDAKRGLMEYYNKLVEVSCVRSEKFAYGRSEYSERNAFQYPQLYVRQASDRGQHRSHP